MEELIIVLLKWEIAAILGNGFGFQGQSYAAWIQISKMFVEG